MQISRSQFTDALNKLGSSENEIVGNLIKLGIKGTKLSPCNCPISNYLVKELGFANNDDVIVDHTRICFPRNKGEQTYSCPALIAEVIVNFDRGNYKDLENTALKAKSRFRC